MKRSFLTRLLIAAALVTTPAMAGTAVTYSSAGWYLWMASTEPGSTFREAVSGPFTDQPACLAERDGWIESSKKDNPNEPARYQYSCSYHDHDWLDDQDGYGS